MNKESPPHPPPAPFSPPPKIKNLKFSSEREGHPKEKQRKFKGNLKNLKINGRPNFGEDLFFYSGGFWPVFTRQMETRILEFGLDETACALDKVYQENEIRCQK